MNFELPGIHQSRAEQFGAFARCANEQDPSRRVRVDPRTADNSHVCITWARTRGLRQSAATLQEAVDGLPRRDRRLFDEIEQFLDTDLAAVDRDGHHKFDASTSRSVYTKTTAA